MTLSKTILYNAALDFRLLFYKIENDIYILFFFFFYIFFFYFLLFPWINEYYFEVSPAKENLSLYVWCGLETEVCQSLLITKCIGYAGIVMFFPSTFPFFFSPRAMSIPSCWCSQ